MVSKRQFRKAWNRMLNMKAVLEDGNADLEYLELAQEEYDKNKAIVDKYYDDFF